MAPDFFETDRSISDIDIGGSLETAIDTPSRLAPRRPRLSLFQIVCMQNEAAAPPSAQAQ
jgi:hypothetical protein